MKAGELVASLMNGDPVEACKWFTGTSARMASEVLRAEGFIPPAVADYGPAGIAVLCQWADSLEPRTVAGVNAKIGIQTVLALEGALADYQHNAALGPEVLRLAFICGIGAGELLKEDDDLKTAAAERTLQREARSKAARQSNADGADMWRRPALERARTYPPQKSATKVAELLQADKELDVSLPSFAQVEKTVRKWVRTGELALAT